jgi:shikimate dehydrogenase
MLPDLSGATRIHLIVGDPVVQTKSPAGLTAEFAARGVDAVCVPMQVAVADIDAFFAVAKRVQNIDGIVVTVPHKLAATRHCDVLSERSRALGAVNAMRRGADGRWSGDMTDGVALVAALRTAGCAPNGRRALVIGAGGAGSAVVLALAEAGARAAVHDIDAVRRDDLVRRLAAWKVAAASADPAGCDLVVNATPLGMALGDDLPVDVTRLGPGVVAADLVTRPAVTPFLTAARERGAQIVTGADMFAPQAGILVDFLLSGRLAGS